MFLNILSNLYKGNFTFSTRVQVWEKLHVSLVETLNEGKLDNLQFKISCLIVQIFSSSLNKFLEQGGKL